MKGISFPESWRLARLGDVCEIIGGGTPSRSNLKFFEGEIPWVTPTDVTALDGLYLGKPKECISEDGLNSSSAKLLPVGSVLMTSRATIGATAIIQEPSTTNQGFANFVCDHRVLDNRYLSYWLRSIKELLINQAGGTTFKEIGRSTIKKLSIAVPPLEEQQEIVSILQQAEELRRLRQDSLAKTEKLASALFLEMFGHPISNPKKWNETQRLGQKAEVVSGFTKGRKTQGKSVREVPYLAVANVQDNYLKLENVKTIDATDNEIGKYKLQVNDLLLTEGGDPDKLGRGALWQEELPECIHQNHIFRVRLTTTDIHPVFLNYLVGSIRGKNYFLRTAKQTTGIASINISQLKAFPLLIPPLDLQERFAQGINSIDMQVEHLKSQLSTLEAFLKTLQFQVFSGKLTENWRQLHNDLQAPNIKAVHVDASADVEIHSSHKSLYQIQSKRESIYDQLSTFQKTVWDHVIKADVESETPEQAYITADLPRLIADLPDEITTDDQVRLGTTLATLTSLGLIAKVSLPDDNGNYVTAYRAIREEDELSPLQRQVN